LHFAIYMTVGKYATDPYLAEDSYWSPPASQDCYFQSAQMDSKTR
jgi:hypothetical protein